jgi:hypothetical protein
VVLILLDHHLLVVAATLVRLVKTLVAKDILNLLKHSVGLNLDIVMFNTRLVMEDLVANLAHPVEIAQSDVPIVKVNDSTQIPITKKVMMVRVVA